MTYDTIISSKLSFSLFTIVISWDFLLRRELCPWQNLPFGLFFLEASAEDMLLMAYVDARTTKFYFHNFFLAVPMFAS
jgi:hypothetical protein